MAEHQVALARQDEEPSAFPTVRFLMTSEKEQSLVTGYLSIVGRRISNVGPHGFDQDLSYSVDFQAENCDAQATLKWLQNYVDDCRVDVVNEEQRDAFSGSGDLTKLVREMANMWMESQSRGNSMISLDAESDRLEPPKAPALHFRSTSSKASLNSNSTSGLPRLGYDSDGTMTPSSGIATPATPAGNAPFDEKRLFNLLSHQPSFISEPDSVLEITIKSRHEEFKPKGHPRPLLPEDPYSPFSSSPAVTTSLVDQQEKALEALQTDTASSGRDKVIPATEKAELPSIILPHPPSVEERYIYAKTRRLPLYLFGTFSFLSVSVGMWFFAISSAEVYWFGFFCGLVQIYLIISYTVGYCGRDFDVDHHKAICKECPITEKCPTVDVYLPCCGEPIEVLENTYKYVQKLDYPNLKVHVLDDGASDSVKNLAESYGFNYIRRDNRPYLKKAGNLRYAFARTTGDFFVILDADFCPTPDFLHETMPWMLKYPDIAIVQSPQFFRPCAEQTWVEQGASATQELFYRIVQVNRDRWGASICVGSCALYRREALKEVGGTAEIGHSEDVHTGFYALTRGWRLKYIPLALACGVSPDTPKAFFSQQMRWCSGSTHLLTNMDFWKSKLSIIQKICYLSGMMYYSASGLMIFLTPLPGILVIWLKPDLVMWYNIAYAFPSLIYSLFIFRLWSRQRYNMNVNFVFVIQSYAYLMAVKDRLFNTTAAWVPSGDNSAHGAAKKKKAPNNKYRNSRILCTIWTFGTTSTVIAGTIVRSLQGYNWYNFFPVVVLDMFNLFLAHRFIFYSH